MIRKIRHIDKQSWMLILLAAVMAGLLAYLFTIDRDIDNYNAYESRIQRMILLDKIFDNFLLRKIEAMNYERINHRLEEFEALLDYFRDQPLSEEYGFDARTLLQRIAESYEKKRDEIERFKSSNAAALNSIHYIFDLRRTLARDDTLPPDIQGELDTILFELMQYILGIHPSTERLQRSLDGLEGRAEPYHDRFLQLFIHHSRALIQSVGNLYVVSDRGLKIPLDGRLNALRIELQQAYTRKIEQEKLLTLLFFVVGFTMILTVAWLNQIARKTYKRLQAFMYAVENSDNTIVMTDAQRNIVYVNEVFERTTGYTKEEAIGQNPRILKSGEQDDSYYAEMNRILNEGKKWEGMFINKRKDGSLFYEKASIVPVYIDGELTNYLAIKLDITEYVEQQKRLRLSAAVFENAQESIFITDRHNRIVSANKACEKLFGYREEEILGEDPSIFKSGRHDEDFYAMMWQSIRRTGEWHGKIYNRTKTGEIIPGFLNISTVYDDNGAVLNHIGMFTDLREIIDSQERAEYLAFHDVLTALPNRVRFEEHLSHTLEVAGNLERQIAVLFIDLDRFKVINDTLGHDVGDKLLKKVSERIRSVLNRSDHLARIGGDEFVAVLETIQSAEDAAYVCEKILQSIAEPFHIGPNTLNISTSIGVALYPDNGRDMTELIKNADNAMYLAKSLGKNNFQFFMPELSRKMHRRLEIEQGLNNALTNGEFWVAYQPQYRLEDHSLHGAEALLRWESPTLGIVPPDEFISVAEETGKISQIGKYVFEEACRTLARLDALGYRLDNIAVNVSSKQFTEKGLTDYMTDTVAQYGLTPSRITLEITERYIMDTTAYDDRLLDTFKALGFRISVDDFGTGYSSMSYLKKLPIDTIKIDKSFIRDIPADLSDNEITKAIIALSSSLGYKTVAEGIENEEQERFLFEHGCHYGQGYHYARPLGYDAFVRFVEESYRSPRQKR